jgi:hypothetical protein
LILAPLLGPGELASGSKQVSFSATVTWCISAGPHSGSQPGTRKMHVNLLSYLWSRPVNKPERAHLFVSANTHSGMRGKNNEDRYAVSTHRFGPNQEIPSVLAVVCDGIGAQWEVARRSS